ncbi:MAG: twin-arginine translocation pathway signal protein [Planctomycetota bacterium]|nr:MAG: twin-arginine translocation pathway signal protein [Planctomycetota bacterium]
MTRRTRRQFVQESAALGATLAVGAAMPTRAAEGKSTKFACAWSTTPDRPWIGPEYWSNPLQDWRIADGRLECIKAAPDRHVHLLTYDLADTPGGFSTSVRLGRVGGPIAGGAGSAGFRVGLRGPLDDYRNALIFGQGIDAGMTAGGKLFIGDPEGRDTADVNLARPAIVLEFLAEPAGKNYSLVLTARDADSGQPLGEVKEEGIAAERLVGGLALVANYGSPRPNRRRRQPAAKAGLGTGKFWFADWQAEGEKLVPHPERSFGPILFSQYTLSGGTLKLTAQMPPVGQDDAQTVRLEITQGGNWQPVGEEPIHPQARTATFRVDDWDAGANAPFRLIYVLKTTDGNATEHTWEGKVRRDPADRDELVVGDVSCNGHMAFPNALYTANMAKLDPDLLAFTGDQFYESSGGYGVQRGPVDMAILDLLRKWYLHGWTWRELMRDRPSISIPDDHDVYQGNIWGEGGEARHGTQEMGGYDMPPEWVNVVHRTQTSHHPDPFDPTPGKRDISVYYGPMVYGRVSFAILADRQFKSGPEGKVPPTGDRGDHVVDPNFDPKTADLPGLELLGERQMRFLRQWARDWDGADMKAVVSQTIFTAMATTHGGNRQVLRADYDANGWPQTARNEALRELTRAMAFHIAGDQHLPAVIRYGINEHGDAIAAVAGPAVNSIYPRWWEPNQPDAKAKPGQPEGTGDFVDHFGHPLTVLAVANPTQKFRAPVLEAQQDKACGIALVRFDKSQRRVTVDCWPILADTQQPNTQFPGWPVIVEPLADNAQKAAAWLPKLKIAGTAKPVVQVLDAAGELVYNARTAVDFQPHAYTEGLHTVRVLDPETGKSTQLAGLVARPANHETIEVLL